MNHSESPLTLVNNKWTMHAEPFAPQGVYMNPADYAFGQGFYNGVWIKVYV
jgi:hypothetical protein